MTTEVRAISVELSPFILRFAEPMAQAAPQRMRYDSVRQIAQVEVNGSWIDTPDALQNTAHLTRLTKVQAETTDDE